MGVSSLQPQQNLFADGGLESGAIFSPCRKWRYVLWRVRDPRLKLLVNTSLNPSKADAVRSDNTVTKMVTLARLWGFGGLIQLNIYAWRATSPAEMMKQGVDAIGEENDYWIQEVHRVLGPGGRDIIGLQLASWGTKDFLNRAPLIKEMIPNLHHLGLNKDQSPKHPLYLPLSIKPQPFVL